MNILPTIPVHEWAVHELVAFRPSAELPAEVPGGAEVLKIAADRWLIIGPRPAAAAASSTFALINVTGKWREFRLAGPGARKLLANCVNVEELLADRVCARTTLFDCPAVLRKQDDGYSIWIERSYLHAFLTAAQQAEAL